MSVCVRCGRDRPAETMVYSSYTRAHYCGVGTWQSCDSRAKRLGTTTELLRKKDGRRA